MKEESYYNSTGQSLDGIISTIATLVPTGLTFSLINNDGFEQYSRVFSILLAFGIMLVLLHFLSFVVAHYAQIHLLKLTSDKKNLDYKRLYKRYGDWTHYINRIVYTGIVIQLVLIINLFLFIY